jgi:demethylmenaquinone methyltransferase/2-methoxy-6-polyprenyl-1,4-benzoquinol methylase
VLDIDAVLDDQRDYYRARAPEYDDWWNRAGRAFRSDRHSTEWWREVGEAQSWVAGRGIGGDVLELAGGTGNWTVELEQHATSLTVVDSSPETLAINHSKLADPSRVEFVVADVFGLEPVRRFDVVFFSFWLSHVPAERFASFWRLVDRCLAPGGRVVVVDSAHPSVMSLAPDSGLAPTSRPSDYVGGQGGISLDGGTAERVLDDGSRHRIIKRFWMPEGFEAEMAGLGWTARAQNTRFFFLLAELERQPSGT